MLIIISYSLMWSVTNSDPIFMHDVKECKYY